MEWVLEAGALIDAHVLVLEDESVEWVWEAGALIEARACVGVRV